MWSIIPQLRIPQWRKPRRLMLLIISGAGIPCRGSFLFCRLDAAGCLLRSAVLSNARKIRAFLFADGPGFPRTILRKAGIRPVPDPPEPMLLHEPEGSLWRERI